MAVWMFAAFILSNKYFSEVLSEVSSPHRTKKVETAKELLDFRLYTEPQRLDPNIGWPNEKENSKRTEDLNSGFQEEICDPRNRNGYKFNTKYFTNNTLISRICEKLVNEFKTKDQKTVFKLIQKCDKTAYIANTIRITNFLTKARSTVEYQNLPIYTGTDEKFQKTEYLQTYGRTGRYILRKMGAVVASGILELWRELLYGTKYHLDQEKNKSQTAFILISFDSLFGTISYVLLIGYTLAFAILMIEWVFGILIKGFLEGKPKKGSKVIDKEQASESNGSEDELSDNDEEGYEEDEEMDMNMKPTTDCIVKSTKQVTLEKYTIEKRVEQPHVIEIQRIAPPVPSPEPEQLAASDDDDTGAEVDVDIKPNLNALNANLNTEHEDDEQMPLENEVANKEVEAEEEPQNANELLCDKEVVIKVNRLTESAIDKWTSSSVASTSPTIEVPFHSTIAKVLLQNALENDGDGDDAISF
ncbi:unnamed protein product [Orchesella dallaii]|uniref:Uncharacterized protein n=1 Tax=Orchesella dallaii TaxID=48710 RepID=A0ABP1REI4_9HEXA